MEIVAEIGLRVVGELVGTVIVHAVQHACSDATSSTSTSTERSSTSSHTPRVIKSGYFMKEGHWWKNWKPRYFCLRGSTITYHERKKDETVLGKIELNGALVHVATRYTDFQFGDRECLVIEDTQNAKTFYLFPHTTNKALDQQQIQEWLTVMEKKGAVVVQAPPSEHELKLIETADEQNKEEKEPLLYNEEKGEEKEGR